MDPLPPPPYEHSLLSSPPYSAEQPSASSSHSGDISLTFHVGLHELRDPLVQVKHIKLHLCFLDALCDLRRRVESLNDTPWCPLVTELDGEQRWSWFVNLAVERRVLCVEDISFASRCIRLDFSVG
jgi:hypothetical protein